MSGGVTTSSSSSTSGTSVGSRHMHGTTAADLPNYDNFAWSQKTISPGISPRDGAMMSFLAGKWWIIGGWNPHDLGFPGSITTNEVWSSPDLVTWTLRLAYDAAPPTSGAGARFKRRHWHGQIEYTDSGTTYIYVMGGDAFSSADADFTGVPSAGYQCDVWRSPDGLTWTRMATSDSVSWAGRMVAVFGQSPGKLWCFGGQNGLNSELAGACIVHNDLHVSTDGGATWTVALADAAASATRPSGRGIINRLAYWQGLLWLVGGGTYDTAADANRYYYREVWSIDPGNVAAGWTQHRHPPWIAAEYTSVEVFQNQLWLMGGYSGVGYSLADGQNTRWVYSSPDGETWRRRETPLWLPSHADATAVSGLTLGHAMGNGSVQLGPGVANDPNPSRIYALTDTITHTPTVVPAPRASWDVAQAVLNGANIVSIPDATGNGHDLVADTPGDATYTASDADFGGKPSANSIGSFFLHTVDAVDLSAFSLFVVGKFATTDPFFYHHYAATSGQTYEYVGSHRIGQHAPRVVLSIDVRRAGVSTTGAANSGVIDQVDIDHVYTTHYDGTAAGTFVAIDSAVSVPDDVALTGDAGTGAWSSLLYFLSANDGSGSKAGKIAAARLYPALTLAQRQAVQDELRGLYPYSMEPLIFSLSNDTSDPLGGGSVVITGEHFTGTTGAGGVKFGTTNATSYTVDSDTQITAVAPANAAGVTTLTVVNRTTSNAVTYEFWSPTLFAPRVFWDGGNYTIPGGNPQWPSRSHAWSTNGDMAGAASIGGTAPTNSSGSPQFIQANSNALQAVPPASNNMQSILGNGDFAIYASLNIASISTQADEEKLDGILMDQQMYVGLGLKHSAGPLYEALFLGFDSADRKVKATIALGKNNVIVKRESGVLYMTVDGGVTWVTGPALGAISGGVGLVMGLNYFASTHAANGFLDATVSAMAIDNVTCSSAQAAKWKKWAASRHP